MSKGMKTGGRQKGTPNIRTQEAMAILEKLDCNPIEGMARIANDESNTIELRAKMYSELAPYIYPKRKAIETTNNDENLIIIDRSKEIQNYTDDELCALIENLENQSKDWVC